MLYAADERLKNQYTKKENKVRRKKKGRNGSIGGFFVTDGRWS